MRIYNKKVRGSSQLLTSMHERTLAPPWLFKSSDTNLSLSRTIIRSIQFKCWCLKQRARCNREQRRNAEQTITNLGSFKKRRMRRSLLRVFKGQSSCCCTDLQAKTNLIPGTSLVIHREDLLLHSSFKRAEKTSTRFSGPPTFTMFVDCIQKKDGAQNAIGALPSYLAPFKM